MSRPRKPTWMLEDNGAFRKNPARRRSLGREPQTSGSIGDCPDYVNARQSAAWHELIGEATAGSLARSDRKCLEMTALLVCRMRLEPARIFKTT